jgi:putative hydrolase of the HAD superfamily
LPIGFDVVENYSPSSGESSDFHSWVKHCTHFITTSVSEGFGLTFLEAAAHGKPLIGRNIERIATEHSRHGIQAGNLYDHLLVPLDWVDQSILRGHFDTCIERNFRYLGRQLTKPLIEDTFAELIKDGWLDFGNLPEPLQQGVVERLNDPGTKSIPRVIIGKEDKPAREWLFEVLKNRKPTVTTKQLSPYSTKEYSKTIKAIYEDLASQQLEELNFLDPSPILDAHLEPKMFHFLCSVIPPRPASWSQYRAVIFDIYGTLLIAPARGVQVSPALDGLLRNVLVRHGYSPPESPSQALFDAVKRHHEQAEVPFPEVDLRVLWREILSLNSRADVTSLVVALESECRPSQPMLGAAAFIRRLAHSGVSLGLLSNGQCNTLRSLGGIRDFFAPELTILSYQHGIAKPAPELFQLLKDRLACQSITPAETLFIGNDPVQDIVPAAAFGFRTALFTGHPDSFRPGNCTPDHEISEWPATGVAAR